MGSDRVEQCYSSADEGSVAPRRRNGAPTINPVNDFLAAMREEWFWKSNEEKLRLLRHELLFIADPVSHLDEYDHVTLSGLSLGELYHARLVIHRLVYLIENTPDQLSPSNE